MNGRVSGKVALVTGAGTGIGRAVAVRLAEEGAEVVVTSRTASHVEETCRLVEHAAGRPALGVGLDVTRQQQVDEAVGLVRERFGRLDILSNNAGIDDPDETPVAETTDAVWGDTFDVNVTGTFRVCRAAIPLLSDGASVVNVASGNAIVPRSNAAAYCASKAALLQLTRSLALELAPRRIRANCVCPGVVDTPLTDLFLARTEDPEATRVEYARSNPLQRIADPREIANCVLFLASDESSFMTGAPLIVDGGGLAGD
jgi:NAD(P)-dependent dehydrogenase (short-subunit alcohol dehydrogenase family)